MTLANARIYHDTSLKMRSYAALLPFIFFLISTSVAAPFLSVNNDTRKNEFQNSIKHATTPKERIETAITAGDWFSDYDDNTTALIFYSQAMNEGKLFANDPLYAKSLVKVADLEDNRYLARFQYMKAKEIYEMDDTYKEPLADVLEKLVWTYDVLKKDTYVAIDLLSEANLIRKSMPFHPAYTENIRALAWFYEYQKDFKKADSYYSLAIDLDIKHLGFDDIRTVLSMENLAQFYIDYQNYPQAIKLLRKKHRSHLESPYIDYYNLGRTESMLGWSYLQLNDLKNAEIYFKNALKHINVSITKNENIPHYYSIPALFDLVYLYTYQRNFQAAEPYYISAKELLLSEGEGDVIEYLKHAEIDQVPKDGIGGFPWSIKAQILGVQSMAQYLATKIEQ